MPANSRRDLIQPLKD